MLIFFFYFGTFFFNKFCIKLRADSEKSSEKFGSVFVKKILEQIIEVKFTSKINLKRWSLFLWLKGGLPEIISYRKQPRLQQSTGAEWPISVKFNKLIKFSKFELNFN